jgi:hypothetical protein
VGVFPWKKDDDTITTRSDGITGAEMTPELMTFLLSENSRVRFGAFGLDLEKDIFYEHTIVGSTCNKEELRASIMAVVLTSDDTGE